jgi:hypothetical protein
MSKGPLSSLLPAVLAAAVLLGVAPAPGAGGPGVPAAAADLLRRFVGTWDATMQVVGPPGEPPQILNGIEINTSGGQGLWVAGDFRSQIDGRPFQGHALLAWDAASQGFRRLWADSTSSTFWISAGTWDPKSATLTMWIETRNSNGDPVRWREETVFKDDGRTFTMYVPGPTTVEAAAMTIAYRRHPATQKVPPAAGPVLAPAGPELAVLKGSAGVWSMRVDDRSGGEEIKGTETNAWCCDGHFLLSDVTGTIGRRPYAARAVYGWDPDKRRYERALVDTAGASFERVPGAWDAAASTLSFHLDLPDGHGGTTHAQEVQTFKENGERTTTVTAEAPGGGKVMRVTRYKKER